MFRMIHPAWWLFLLRSSRGPPITGKTLVAVYIGLALIAVPAVILVAAVLYAVADTMLNGGAQWRVQQWHPLPCQWKC